MYGYTTREEFLNWIINQLQREDAVLEYDMLFHFYWKARREEYLFTLEYIQGQNKAGYVPEALVKIVEILKKKEEENEPM